MLRNCPLASFLWIHLLKVGARSNFFGSDLDDWIDLNLSSSFGQDEKGFQLELWATACYSLWFWRNKQKHDENFVRPFKLWEFILSNHHRYMAPHETVDTIDMKGSTG